jgi:hypothetical protein
MVRLIENVNINRSGYGYTGGDEVDYDILATFERMGREYIELVAYKNKKGFLLAHNLPNGSQRHFFGDYMGAISSLCNAFVEYGTTFFMSGGKGGKPLALILNVQWGNRLFVPPNVANADSMIKNGYGKAFTIIVDKTLPSQVKRILKIAGNDRAVWDGTEPKI